MAASCQIRNHLYYSIPLSVGQSQYQSSIENVILGTKIYAQVTLDLCNKPRVYLHWTIPRNGRFTRLCWRLLPRRSDRWQPPERAAEPSSPMEVGIRA